MSTGYRLTEAQRQRLGVAVHEAAHAVLGVLAFATVERAALTESDDGLDGLCEFSEDSFALDSRRYSRALVAAAGPVAEAVFHHGQRVNPRLIERHLGPADREELRLASFHSHSFAEEQLWNVHPVIVRCWRPIGTLAMKIYAGNEIGHRDVCAALGLSDDGGPYSVELTRIRSGGTPRTSR